MSTREQMWQRLDGDFDVAIIGGGINGAGIARDAARRGLRVALLEMADIASGTSSRSSKLIHGGLRYLEQLELSLVFESVSERRILLDLAPHLVTPMEFLLPVYRGRKPTLFTISAGMWLYDGLALFRAPARHRRLRRADVEAQEPALRRAELSGAQVYYDCATDDARLTLETVLDAVDQGAVVATWAQVVGMGHDKQGQVRSLRVRDRLDGRETEVRAKIVVNASGPWTDSVLALSRAVDPTPVLRCTKGVHLVTSAKRAPVAHAIVATHPDDRRVFFIIPWGEQTYIGTTDTDYEGDPAAVAATRADIDYILAGANHYLPDAKLGYNDVRATWAGLRPLVAPPPGKSVSESSVSREHRIILGHDGLLTIAGGKLTTYRRMARQIVDNVVQMLRLADSLPETLSEARTDQVPLPGGRFWPADDLVGIAVKCFERAGGTIDERRAGFLATTYGTLSDSLAELLRENPELAQPLAPQRPELLVQVDWAVRRELAATLGDVMVRRTQLFFRDPDQGLGIAPTVAARMSALLGWSRDREHDELARYRDEVGRSRAWREG